jgi:hypothetical protein
MVAAYRRFLDDQISYGYGVVARAIREVDPHHLLGVRTGYGGNGFPGIDPQMPFDLASGAKHLDFISPEGYSFGPEWESVRRAGLVTQYARRVGGGKPVWWAEYGLTIYSPSDERVGDPYHARPDLAARQRDLYVNFARMFIESRANGGAGWWLPGGYRIGENSDYGIFNPDGTARPAALAIREWSPRIGAIRAPEGKADVAIRIDRDVHPRGFSQIRARHAEEYARAVEAGRSVALATSGTGTNSANAPLVAVGNRPYNGANPPKYLNAEFERFWVKIGEGPWREARDGDRIAVPRGTSLFGRAEVANTGEAAWVAPKEGAAPPVGSVRLVTARGSELPLRSGAPLAADTPFLKTGEFRDFEIAGDVKRDATIELELEAAARARFGRHFRLRLEVEPVGKP